MFLGRERIRSRTKEQSYFLRTPPSFRVFRFPQNVITSVFPFAIFCTSIISLYSQRLQRNQYHDVIPCFFASDTDTKRIE